jgi:hypothetical protein
MNPNDRKILKRALSSLPPSRKASVIAALGVTAKVRGDWDSSTLSIAVNTLVDQSTDLDMLTKYMELSSKSKRAIEAASNAIFDMAESLSEELDFEVRY